MNTNTDENICHIFKNFRLYQKHIMAIIKLLVLHESQCIAYTMINVFSTIAANRYLG